MRHYLKTTWEKSLTLKIIFFLFNRIGIYLWRSTGNNEDAKLNEQCEKRKHLLKERIFRLARWLGRLKCLPHGKKPHSLSSVCGTHVRRREPIPKSFPLTSTRGMRLYLHSHRHTLVNKNKFKKFYDFSILQGEGAVLHSSSWKPEKNVLRKQLVMCNRKELKYSQGNVNLD